MRFRNPQLSLSRAQAVRWAPEGAGLRLAHWLPFFVVGARVSAVSSAVCGALRKNVAVSVVPQRSGLGCSAAKRQRLPALSCRVRGAASPLVPLLERLRGIKSQKPGAVSLLTHQAFPTLLAANITVKAVPAFGLHWTSRKRAALYLKR